MIVEADVVRLKADERGERPVPAGTEGYVVHADGETVVVDVSVEGEPDTVILDHDKVEFVRKGQPIH